MPRIARVKRPFRPNAGFLNWQQAMKDEGLQIRKGTPNYIRVKARYEEIKHEKLIKGKKVHSLNLAREAKVAKQQKKNERIEKMKQTRANNKL
jgi:predicted nuclease with TOPRIM domain